MVYGNPTSIQQPEVELCAEYTLRNGLIPNGVWSRTIRPLFDILVKTENQFCFGEKF